jgi:hypothetical protein
MHIEFFVEEPSAEAALQAIVPKIAGQETSFQVHPFEGKPDLLKRLPDRLKAYRNWLPADWRIVVLVDEDRQDCLKLKRQLEGMCVRAGISTKTKPRPDGFFHAVNRIAVEELEAWFFGDPQAVLAAYPGVAPGFAQGRRFRDPDAISGGTAEALGRILRRAGYYRGGLGKIQAARDIACHMDPGRNRSRSFCHFRDALGQFTQGD